MNQNRFHGVTGSGLLELCVFNNSHSLSHIRAGLDVDVAVSFPGLDHRNPGLVHYPPDEFSAAPWKNYVDLASGVQDFVYLVPVAGIRQSDRFGNAAAGDKALFYGLHYGPVRFQGSRGTSKQD